MELLIPNKVTEQVHRLARTTEKYEGIKIQQQGDMREDVPTHGYNIRKRPRNT